VTAALGPERRLAQLRLILPAVVPPAGRYVPAARGWRCVTRSCSCWG
jgi:hypothetical protein